MHLDLRRFPVRPKPKLGESLTGFFTRYFSENGHRIPARLLGAIRTVYLSGDSPECHEAWTLINEVLDTSSGERPKFWTEEWFQMIHVQTAPIKPHAKKISTREFRFCAECLQSQNVHLAFWDLPLVFACPIHHRMLVTHCQCGAHLTWANLGLSWTCFCGHFLPSITVGFAPRSLIGGAKSIAVAISLPMPELSYQEAQLYRLGGDLRATYNVLIFLNLLFRRLRKAHKTRLNSRISKYWRYGSALEDWPNGLVSILRRLLKRWCPDDGRIPLIIHERTSPANQLLKMLDDALTDRSRPSFLQGDLAVNPADYLLSSRAIHDRTFNPAYSVSKREKSLNNLRNGWLRLPDRKEAANETQDKGPVRIHSMTQRRHTARVDTLYAAFTAILMDTRSLSATELFELLAERLLMVSSTHRKYLIQLILDAVDVTG